jgi:uncharacterized protein
MTTLRPIDDSDLVDLAIGSWILGTGGGGDPYHSLLEMRKLYALGHRVSLMDPLDLADDALVAQVGQMGSPTVIQEKLTDANVMAETIRMMESHLGRRFDAIMLWEVGGNNCFQPFLAGALLDLPVVAADAMGRAFPRADMTSFAIRDLPAYPWTMVDIRANRILFAEAVDWTWMERMTRKACTVFGSVAATCKAPRSGREVKAHGLLHTVTRALRIGATVREARKAHADPIAAVVEAEGGKTLFRGKVTDVARRTTEGWLRGSFTLDGLDEDLGSAMRIDFQNEFAVAWRDGEVVVTTPELICVMDSHSGEAVGTDTLRYGQRLTVIALRAPDILLTEKGIRHVGPRAFGHDVDFTTVFGEDA